MAEPIAMAGPMARAIRGLDPDFVFAQEVLAYGPVAVTYRRAPVFIMPWGSDVYYSPFTTAAAFETVRWSLRAARAVYPTSMEAAAHITSAFGVAGGRARGMSWGVDRTWTTPVATATREDIAGKWRLNPSLPIVVYPRKFSPFWGSSVATKSMLLIASSNCDVQIVVLGGRADEPYMSEAEDLARAAGVFDRFTFIDRIVTLDEYRELLEVSDVFVSVVPRGDMRSTSVLQGSACGCVPVIGETCEYRSMFASGMQGALVDPLNPYSIADAVLDLLGSTERRRAIARQNRDWVLRHEDHDERMDQLLATILEQVDGR